jgi:hypothetical protein
MTKSLDPKVQFIRDMREQIINEELPAISRYLLDLEKIAQNGNARIQRAIRSIELEAVGQDEIIIEGIRAIYRLRNIIHQLLNADLIMELIQGIEDDEEPNDL